MLSSISQSADEGPLVKVWSSKAGILMFKAQKKNVPALEQRKDSAFTCLSVLSRLSGSWQDPHTLGDNVLLCTQYMESNANPIKKHPQ